jgi:hypothetical protein
VEVHCTADSGVLNEHRWRIQNGITTAKSSVCVVVLGDEICDKLQRHYHMEFGEQAPGGQAIK